jgi:hypothetical protein
MIRDSGKSGNNKHCVRKVKDPIFIYSVVCVSSCVSAVSVGQRRAASSRSLTICNVEKESVKLPTFPTKSGR